MKALIILILFVLSTVAFSQTVLTTQVFKCDFEDGILLANAPDHFRFSEQKAPDRLTVISTGARQGTKCTRIEVRAGDGDVGNPDQERAEFYGPRGADNNTIYITEQSGIRQYEFSIKFDATWQPIQQTAAGQWGTFWQIHPPAEFTSGTPTLSLSATDSVRLDYRCGDVSGLPAKQKLSLSDGALRVGEWTDWRLTIKYTKDLTGFIKVERRNQGNVNYITVLNKTNCSTMSYSPSVNSGSPGNEYIKFGLYRNAQTFTSVMYQDNYIESTVSISSTNNLLKLGTALLKDNSGKLIYY